MCDLKMEGVVLPNISPYVWLFQILLILFIYFLNSYFIIKETDYVSSLVIKKRKRSNCSMLLAYVDLSVQISVSYYLASSSSVTVVHF